MAPMSSFTPSSPVVAASPPAPKMSLPLHVTVEVRQVIQKAIKGRRRAISDFIDTIAAKAAVTPVAPQLDSVRAFIDATRERVLARSGKRLDQVLKKIAHDLGISPSSAFFCLAETLNSPANWSTV